MLILLLNWLVILPCMSFFPRKTLCVSQLEITWEFCLATAFAKWSLLPHFTNVVFIIIRCFLAPFFAQNFYVVLEPFILCFGWLKFSLKLIILPCYRLCTSHNRPIFLIIKGFSSRSLHRTTLTWFYSRYCMFLAV